MIARTGILLLAALTLSACEEENGWEIMRERMVNDQIVRRGVTNPAVLDAVRAVPRHAFVPETYRSEAYDDHPLPIGEGQTISQPYIVALMTELLDPEPGDRVLEVGTGSGYQAAVLAELVSAVYSIEIVEPLARESAARLAALGYDNVTVKAGDGYRGWPEHAPFDAIIVTAAPGHVPKPLTEQLKDGGVLVIPVGDEEQSLLRITRTGNAFKRESVIPVRFVPMTGEAERGRQ
ncbi:MAG: protein-L-isoaspartate(D-aspartate) O-methyltransferase [Gemmatimonadetes bacterium]|nr:protein-L-isoaspartate(D-aspartate) O-methyltransferase [Gemmatimonadota bacterium]